jgi:hypothetical protein
MYSHVIILFLLEIKIAPTILSGLRKSELYATDSMADNLTVIPPFLPLLRTFWLVHPPLSGHILQEATQGGFILLAKKLL